MVIGDSTMKLKIALILLTPLASPIAKFNTLEHFKTGFR